MASTKRAWKLQEFVAHSGGVNCLALGHKSGRVMVTGGDDKKVNMWAVGKPNCIMSLSGHTSPIEAVRFGNAEEMVVAGSMSGALKIWDLEAAKIVRTLTGHKSSIRSLDFHPYGDFVASGSLDTNIKLWDIRRKGCIFTYKGHTNCVNSLRFSPDGRWIASAGEDGILKLWDLTAGKLLTDLKQHTGPVTSVEFHPNEFLLASGSADRTVKLWDLETFQLVSTTDGDSSPVRCIFFHPEGTCIYSGVTDIMKVYGWEPARCFDSLGIGWGKVVDIAIAQNQLIGATFSQTNVSTFVVDVQKVAPFGNESSVRGSAPLSPPPPSTASGRRSFVLERPPTQSTRPVDPPKESPDEPSAPFEDPGDDAQSVADIRDPDDYREIFHPKHRISHSPPKDVQPFPAPPDEARAEPEMPKPVTVKPATAKVKPASAKSTTVRPAAVKPTPVAQAVHAPSPAPTPAPAPVAPVIPASREKPAGLNMDDFMPKKVEPTLEGHHVPSDVSESEALTSIMRGHDSMTAVLNSRGKNLQIVRALWTGGNIKTALDSAIGMNDAAILVDLINILILKPSLWNLDLCAMLLPQVKDLFNSKYENYVQTGCGALKVILKNFAPVIKANMAAPPGIGVDISREERARKCKQCYGLIMDIRTLLDSKHSLQGKLGSKLREIQLLMGQLD